MQSMSFMLPLLLLLLQRQWQVRFASLQPPLSGAADGCHHACHDVQMPLQMPAAIAPPPCTPLASYNLPKEAYASPTPVALRRPNNKQGPFLSKASQLEV